MRQEQKKINQIAHKYKEFSEAAELPTKAERMSVSGYHKVSVKPPKKAVRIVDNAGESGIIKSLDIDDFNLMSEGKNIDPSVIDIISKTVKEYENAGAFYLNDFYLGHLNIETNGVPLLQIEPTGNKTLRLNINTDVFSGKTVAEIDDLLKANEKNLANSLKEAVIHECGHAKSIKGKTIKEIQTFYSEIANSHIEGVSKIAYDDGAEALAEIEILISRRAKIPKKAIGFYNKYMRRNR